MNTRNIIKPISRAIPSVAIARSLMSSASAGAQRLGIVRRRRQRPVFGIAAGLALVAAAAAIIAPSSRRTLQGLLQRTGGGLGKQLGKLLGEGAGSHPLKTARLARGARDLFGSERAVQ